jgi:uncharacterized protein (TIRG00374 family)
MSRRRWILTCVAIGLLIAAALRVDWHSAWLIIRRASPTSLVAAVVINALSVALRGVRWWIFLRGACAAPLSLAIRGTLVGAGLNNVLLANGGDAARVLLVSNRARASRTGAIATLALDRLFDPLCFALILLVATFTIPLPRPLASARLVAALLLAACGVVVVMLLRGRTDTACDEVARCRRHLLALRTHAAALSTPRRLCGAFGISLLVWSMQIATFALVAHSTNAKLPLSGSVAAMLLSDIGCVVRATPGNVGFFQFAYELAARQFDVAPGAAVATALLLQIVQAVPVTLAALVLAPGLLTRGADAYPLTHRVTTQYRRPQAA